MCATLHIDYWRALYQVRHVRCRWLGFANRKHCVQYRWEWTGISVRASVIWTAVVLYDLTLFLFKIDAVGIKKIQAARKEYECERRKSLAPHLAWGSKHPQYSSNPNARASWTEAEMRIILHHFSVIEEQCKVILCISYVVLISITVISITVIFKHTRQGKFQFQA